MMSVQGEADYLRRSMLAGAREFLVKPFSSDELTASIRQVSSRERDKQSRIGVPTPVGGTPATGRRLRARRRGDGQVVAVFSPKGGVGRTTVAVNLAVAAAKELGRKVVVMDGSFQFGDVGVLLNLNPKSKSIADLIPEMDAGGEIDSIDTFVIDHSSGDPRPARAALPGDGRDDHAGRRQEGARGAPARPRPGRSSTAPPSSTTRPWRSWTRPM